MRSIVVFSDRRWDAVARRPQHLFTRLAAGGDRVVYVEPPARAAEGPSLERWHPVPGVEVMRPHLAGGGDDGEIAGRTRGFRATDLPAIATLLEQPFAELAHVPVVAWLETPTALPLVALFPEATVVYDCVRDTAACAGLSDEVLHGESALVARADLIFTANPALRAIHASAHDNVHCITPAVDAAHFRPDAVERTHPAQRAIPEPRIGWFGTIDEAVDLALVAGIADERPDWQLVMVGPITVDPATLPQRPNLHWLGPQGYPDLPAFCTRWDVCLLPMRTDATYAPTRTVPGALLEYMAAERPIVATAFAGLPKICRAAVRTGVTAREIVAACEAAMRESAEERDARLAHMRAIVSANGWDLAVARIRSILRATPKRVRPERLVSLATLVGGEGPAPRQAMSPLHAGV
jgi:glycosyltransferase involved in cell wall biosynthesis